MTYYCGRFLATLIQVFAGVGALPAFGQLTYHPQFSSPGVPPTGGGTSNNSPSFWGNASVIGAGGAQGEQEVKMTLHVAHQPGAAGTFDSYLQATSNADT